MIRFLTGVLICFFLAALALAQVSVGLTWTASTDNTGVAGYNVYRDGVKIGTSPTTSFTDTTAAENTTYSYTVQAFDKAGNVSGTAQPAVILTGFKHGTPVTGAGDVAFSLPTGSVLHFIAPAGLGGSDSNDGLAPTVGGGHGPWLTPNHAMKCGEVILASPGTYSGSAFHATNPTPSNCPSTTGGIDGTGGIWFTIVLCAGSDIGSTNGCVIPGFGNTNGYASVQFEEGQSNWAYSGFYFDTGCVNTGSPGNCSRSFQPRVCNAGSKAHHLALINSITVNSQQGFGFNDCGNAGGTADEFGDYVAAIGVITFNSALNGDYQGGICVGSIDFVGLGEWDTNSGTHAYIYNNYGIKNQSPACSTLYDGHAFYIDTPDAHLFNQTAVIANNIGYQSTRTCIALTYGEQSVSTTTFKIYNNTCFNNHANNNNGDNLEINVNTGNDHTSNFPSHICPALGVGAPCIDPSWTVTVINNISYAPNAVQSGGTRVTACCEWYISGGTVLAPTTVVFGAISGNGQENVFKATQTSCPFAGVCDAGFNIDFNNRSVLPNGATGNFFVNPTFTNTTDLLANRMTVPNCTGFENTTQCMGWDARTGTLTTPSVISDLTATCAQCAGKGFQRPSVTCDSNADYPDWLKGVVGLEASGFTAGATVTRKMGLVTIRCGL